MMSRLPAIAVGLLLAAAAPDFAAAQIAPPPPPAARPPARPSVRPEVRPEVRPATRPAPNSLGADWREQQLEARQGVRRGNLAPLSQVIGQIQRRTPGRQLDAGIEYQGERPVYRVRWVTSGGRRIDYIVDGATGAILSGG
jgi:hypothetical protein